MLLILTQHCCDFSHVPFNQTLTAVDLVMWIHEEGHMSWADFAEDSV